jgi:hypothetical protein
MVMAPWPEARRPNGKPMLAMKVESKAAPGRTDSVAQPVGGQELRYRARPRRRGTYPGGSSASASALANSVGLKNETG